VEPITLAGGRGEPDLSGLDISVHHRAERGAVAQVPALHAVDLRLVQQPLTSVHPPATTGELAVVEQDEPQPERAVGGLGDLARALTVAEGLLPRRDALLGSADQERGDGEPGQVGHGQRVGAVGRGELPEGRGAVVPVEGLASALELDRHRTSDVASVPVWRS